MEDNELYHYGRKGMKWYQNIFTKGKLGGSRKKRDRTDNANDSPEAVKAKPTAYSSARKSVKDMDDAELNAAINRLRQEQMYQQLYSQLNPQQVSKGKQFVTTVWDKAVSPALVDAGKRVLGDFVVDRASKALGLKKSEVKDGLDALKKEVDTLELKKRKALAEDYFENRAKKEQQTSSKDKTKNKSDSGNDKNSESSKTKTGKTTDNKTDEASSNEDKKVYTGTVEDGPKREQKTTSQQKSNKDVVIDVDWKDVTYSDVKKSESVAIGQRYVAGLLGQNTYLLEDKNK